MQLGGILSAVTEKGGATVSALSKVTGVHRNYLKHYLDALVDLQILTRIGDAYLTLGRITRYDQRKVKVVRSEEREVFQVVEVTDTGSNWLRGDVLVQEDKLLLRLHSGSDILVNFQEPILEGTVKDLWSPLTRFTIRGVTQGVVSMILILEKLAKYPDSRAVMYNPSEILIEIPFPKSDEDPETAIKAVENQIVIAVIELSVQEYQDYTSTLIGTDLK